MTKTCSELEAILFAAGEPVPVSRISLILGVPEETVEDAAAELSEVFRAEKHSLSVIRMSDKLQLCSSPEYAPVIAKILEQRRPPSLSPAALETLAIVAYYQPVTAANISGIRGVDSSYTVTSLTEKGLIEGKGRLEAPGRPTLYGTTDLFLRTMQIRELSELPPLPEIASTEGIAKLQQAIDALQQQDPSQEQLTITEL
ncbi:MAG: SMC-Scp complex subunit ScpB [Oscillospiraceae bacterium]|nr:SMC-Scp complex subunit ScpB [Oscillospiraceae bacterium]